MPDLKLFTLSPTGQATECTPTFFGREAQVQRPVEENMETFFGIRFLASEYSTGDLEIVITSTEDLEAAKPFLLESYEIS